MTNKRAADFMEVRGGPGSGEGPGGGAPGVGAAPYFVVNARGAALLRNPFVNKGSAFTLEERAELGLEGLLPPRVSTLEEQLDRALASYREQHSALGKHLYLRALQNSNETLFYALLLRHVEEMLPIVYTPTVGEAVQTFDSVHHEPRGLTITTEHIERIDAILEAWPADDVRMIVATDASAILGIGDRGHGGMAISIGKLALYGAAGVSPASTLPVMLDVGTDRQELREDPLYLGVRKSRLRGDGYFALIDAFARGVAKRWPKAILQWEDLSKDTAFAVLDRHRRTLPSFNDDIQGTGAVTLAGLLAGCAMKGEKLSEQRVVIHGAGAGGAGVARAILAGMAREGLSPSEARSRVLVLDSGGLLIEGAKMEDYKKPLAQPREAVAGWTFPGERPDLYETVRQARATVLLGLSGRANAFDEGIVRVVASNTVRPIVLALSNPTSSCEARPADVIAWTDGRAIVATGSPFEPVQHKGQLHVIGQGNNAFIFPGLGLGAMLSGAREITDEMVLDAAYALAAYIEAKHVPRDVIYPPVSELREVAAQVAAKVILRAAREGLGSVPAEGEKDLVGYVRAQAWAPRYLPVRAREI